MSRLSSFVMTQTQLQRLVAHTLVCAFVVVISVGVWAALSW